jgi:hypothetical protein
MLVAGDIFFIRYPESGAKGAGINGSCGRFAARSPAA